MTGPVRLVEIEGDEVRTHIFRKLKPVNTLIHSSDERDTLVIVIEECGQDTA